MNSKVLKAKRQEKIKGGVYSIVTSGACNNFRAVISKTKLNDDKVNISFEAFDSLKFTKKQYRKILANK
jgi:arginine/ornithine N-succinyltransferase beta subunit